MINRLENRFVVLYYIDAQPLKNVFVYYQRKTKIHRFFFVSEIKTLIIIIIIIIIIIKR
jgi:hypothetical protein